MPTGFSISPLPPTTCTRHTCICDYVELSVSGWITHFESPLQLPPYLVEPTRKPKHPEKFFTQNDTDRGLTMNTNRTELWRFWVLFRHTSCFGKFMTSPHRCLVCYDHVSTKVPFTFGVGEAAILCCLWICSKLNDTEKKSPDLCCQLFPAMGR